MLQTFQRVGPLKVLSSYPSWLQKVVRNTHREKMLVAEHELFSLMRDAKLPKAALRKFLVGAWPTIQQFPQFMALNLAKLTYGSSAGEDLARRYLIHNIRVEQKHVDYWMEWAKSADLTQRDLIAGEGVEPLAALAHWCWYVSSRASAAIAIAATNYAVEGVTGEWSLLVCSKPTFAQSIPENMRGPATRWLRVHAEYDDEHPWEALEIVATILGNNPAAEDIAAVESAIRTTYVYFAAGLNAALEPMAHGSFDETASNASTLGLLDAA